MLPFPSSVQVARMFSYPEFLSFLLLGVSIIIVSLEVFSLMKP